MTLFIFIFAMLSVQSANRSSCCSLMRFSISGSDGSAIKISHHAAASVAFKLQRFTVTRPGPQKGAIAETHDVGSVDQAEQLAGLGGGESGSLAVSGVVLPAADRLEGIQGGGVTGDQGVEEMPQGGESLVRSGAVAGELVNEAASQAGPDPGQLKALPGRTRRGSASLRERRRGGCGDWRFGCRRTHRQQRGHWPRPAPARPVPTGPDPVPGKRAEGQFGQGSGPWQLRQ